MQLFKLDTVILRVHGNAASFLNGLSSNGLDKPRNAFLNLHGRIIATVDQIKTGEDEFLLVVAAKAVESLLTHLSRYARLSRATIEKTDLNAYFDMDGVYLLGPGEWGIAQKQGKIIITAKTLSPIVSDGIFTTFRLKYAIALHMVDYKDEMVLNVSGQDFVSFSKGCFLGQEPVAKVKHRSKPSWKLAVCYQDEVDPAQRVKMTSVMNEPQTGRAKGFAFVANV